MFIFVTSLVVTLADVLAKRKRNDKNNNILYTAYMSFFRHPTPAPTPKTKDVKSISTFYAAILVIMVVAQLFTFDAFLELFASFQLPGGPATGYTLAAVLVAAEVFALPFLLRMNLSPAFRWFSLLCAGLVSDIWLFVTIWILVVGVDVATVGFLGTVVDTMPGWWAVFISLAFGILALWSAWGMWPATSKRRASKKKRARA